MFVAALDAEKCVDSICHVSLFLKLIHVLPVHEWLLLYNWYDKLNAVVKWNGSYSKPFDVTRGTRQGSVLSPYFICDCTYEYVCNVSSPATEAE